MDKITVKREGLDFIISLQAGRVNVSLCLPLVCLDTVIRGVREGVIHEQNIKVANFKDSKDFFYVEWIPDGVHISFKEENRSVLLEKLEVLRK